MSSSRSTWRPALLCASLLAAFLLPASLARGQATPPAKPDDDKPPLPTRKTGDEDPPLPSKKPMPGKEVRVQVTADSAEVQTGDKVIATVKRGDVLPFTKKTDDYYLVVVDGKKGWIKREAVREVEVSPGGADASTVEVPPGPAPAAIDKDTARKVKRATAYLRVRQGNGGTVEGSGFFAAQPGLVFTNAHVLGMLHPGSSLPAEVRVVVHSGEAEEFTLPAEVLAVDRGNDLAVLRVKGRASRFPAPLPVDTSRSLALVQKVYIFGFPFGTSLGKDITASESSVSSIRKDAAGAATQIQVNGGMHRGNSGGPVVDSRGVVVGVAVAVIRGTQINFAVPGEKVQELLAGRPEKMQLGEAFLEKDQTKVPVRLSCLDPLQRIRTVKVEVWTGKPGSARPASATEPKSQAGDGTRQSLAATYQESSGQIDVALPKLAEGEVFWIQPVLTDTAGATRWGAAIAYKPSELAPLERKTALLQSNIEGQARRTIKLNASYTAQVSKGRKETLFRDTMEVEALENAQKETRGGRVDVFLGTYKFTTSEMNGKPRPQSPRAQELLRDRNMTFIVDPQGALVQRTVPVVNARFPLEVREDYTELVHQIANGYEMTCLPVPNREVTAQETWQARLPLILSYQEKKLIVDMFLTCTYEGKRGKGVSQYAVISVSGYLKARKPGQSTAGIVTGKVHFHLADGYLSLANLKVESEGEYDEIAVAHSLELSLTRSNGNTAGITARPVGPIPAAPAATGTDYEAAVPHLQKRDFDKAIPLLEKAVAANPNLVPARIDLGFAYNEKGQFDKAIECLRKAIELEPKNVTARNNLGAAHKGKGELDEAIDCFKKAIELEPNHALTHVNLGNAYSGKKQLDQAIACYEKAIEIDPQYIAAHDSLGNAYNRKRQHDKAIASFKRIIELDKRNPNGHNSLGFSYNAKGQYEDAIACFKKAVEIDPKHFGALNNLGYSYNALGQYDQGISWLKKAIEAYPKAVVAHDNLAAALGEVGELEQACAAYKKALALLPENSPQLASEKRSLEQMEALLALHRELPDILKGERKPKNFQEGMQLGKLCRVKQHYTAAIRLYEQALAGDAEAAKKLAPVNFITHARVALLASQGKGNDPPAEGERAAYRAKALARLQELLKIQQAALEKDYSANRYACQINLRVLLQHKDFAAVRAPALKNLPAAERKDWETFWNEVETQLEKVDALDPDPSANPNP